MIKLDYHIEIHCTPVKVHNIMLGLDEKRTYELWTAVFNPTSTFEGSWNKGEKILFVGTGEDGQKAGMVARIEENVSGKLVSILHYGVLQNGVEITDGPDVEKWAGAHENYYFEESGAGTFVKVEVDTVEEYADYFNSKWPDALKVLKAMCEKD
jgi:hypothetical protein